MAAQGGHARVIELLLDNGFAIDDVTSVRYCHFRLFIRPKFSVNIYPLPQIDPVFI